MKKYMLLLSLLLVAPACNQTEKPQGAADNTAKNVRDRGGETQTPFDQSESEPDRNLTQQIRQAIVSDDALSITAKNIKIISKDGHVTLRGPVQTAEERTIILAKAEQIAGTGRLHDELEIKSY